MVGVLICFPQIQPRLERNDFTCTSIWQEAEWRWRRVEWWGWGERTGGAPNRETHIFFIHENEHVISWCFSLLFFNLCQIWSIYFRASEYVFGPVKFSFNLNICISIYLMELIRALARMACKFQIPKSLTVLWFVIHIL